MAAYSSLAYYFMRDFRADIRGDSAALAVIFDQKEPGRPFFYNCDNPDQIGFIYTNKRGLTNTQHFYIRSHFTGDIITVDYLNRMGISCVSPDQNTVGCLIFTYYEDHHPAPPHFRRSSDVNAISMTRISRGIRADLRLLFYTGPNDSPIPLTVADLDHIYSSAYNCYYMRPG